MEHKQKIGNFLIPNNKILSNICLILYLFVLLMDRLKKYEIYIYSFDEKLSNGTKTQPCFLITKNREH